MRRIVLFLLLAAAPFIAVATAQAQDQNPNSFDPQHPFGPGIVGQFDSSATGEPATITTGFSPATANQPAILMITAQIAPGKHAYSLTQPPGGPQPTKIELDRSPDYRLLAPFRSQPEATAHVETGPVWTGLRIEEHEGEVTWYAPIEITAGINPKKLEIKGTIHMLVCKTGGTCEPVTKEFAAHEDTSPDHPTRIADWPPVSAIGHAQSAVASFQAKGSVAKFSGRLVPATVRPGESAELHITASVPEHAHIYALADRDSAEAPSRR